MKRGLRFGDVPLLVRMLAWAAVLPFLKRVVPVERLAALMWTPQRTSSRSLDDESRIARLAHLTNRPHRRYRFNCLERSLVAYRYLARAGAKPDLVIGLQKDGAGVSGHAWVVVDGRPVRESPDEVRAFQPFVAFGWEGRRLVPPPPASR
jgi:hypothetical protein